MKSCTTKLTGIVCDRAVQLFINTDWVHCYIYWCHQTHLFNLLQFLVSQYLIYTFIFNAICCTCHNCVFLVSIWNWLIELTEMSYFSTAYVLKSTMLRKWEDTRFWFFFLKEGKIKAVSERQIAFKKRNEQISSLHWRIHWELTRRWTIIFDCQLVVSNEKFKKKKKKKPTRTRNAWVQHKSKISFYVVFQFSHFHCVFFCSIVGSLLCAAAAVAVSSFSSRFGEIVVFICVYCTVQHIHEISSVYGVNGIETEQNSV